MEIQAGNAIPFIQNGLLVEQQVVVVIQIKVHYLYKFNNQINIIFLNWL
jgi:hypothetical protein